MQLVLGQTRGQLGAPVVAVSQGPPLQAAQELFGNSQVMPISRRQLQVGNDTRPANPQVDAQAEELLACYFIVAIGSVLAQTTRVGSAGEATNRQRQAIDDGEGRVKVHLLQQRSPQQRFDPPQVRRLTPIGRAMNLGQLWKVMVPVTTEVVKGAFIGFQAQKAPTTSIVNTSLSASVGCGPRCRRRMGCCWNQSSMNVNTLTINVLRSMVETSLTLLVYADSLA